MVLKPFMSNRGCYLSSELAGQGARFFWPAHIPCVVRLLNWCSQAARAAVDFLRPYADVERPGELPSRDREGKI